MLQARKCAPAIRQRVERCLRIGILLEAVVEACRGVTPRLIDALINECQTRVAGAARGGLVTALCLGFRRATVWRRVDLAALCWNETALRSTLVLQAHDDTTVVPLAGRVPGHALGVGAARGHAA